MEPPPLHAPGHAAEWALTDPTGGDPSMGGPVNIRVCALCGREPRLAERALLGPVPQPQRMQEPVGVSDITMESVPARRRLFSRPASERGFHLVVLLFALSSAVLALGGMVSGRDPSDAMARFGLSLLVAVYAARARRSLRDRA